MAYMAFRRGVEQAAESIASLWLWFRQLLLGTGHARALQFSKFLLAQCWFLQHLRQQFHGRRQVVALAAQYRRYAFGITRDSHLHAQLIELVLDFLARQFIRTA